MPVKPRPAWDRAQKFITRGDGCRMWGGALRNGYGVIAAGRRGEGLHYAHRLAFENLVGPIPSGLHIDHLCRNRACVNPSHLEPVTQGENNRRAWAAKKEPAA